MNIVNLKVCKIWVKKDKDTSIILGKVNAFVSKLNQSFFKCNNWPHLITILKINKYMEYHLLTIQII